MNAWHYQILRSGVLDMQGGFKDQTYEKIGVSKLSLYNVLGGLNVDLHKTRKVLH